MVSAYSRRFRGILYRVSVPHEAMRSVQRKRTENPRTILAFYATAIGLLFAAVVAIATAMLVTGEGLHLLPWLVGFGAVAFVLMIGGVFAVSLQDPSKLMLGQVTGEEYAEIQRMTLGDSASGERLTTVVTAEPAEVIRSASPAITAGGSIDEYEAEDEDEERNDG